LDAQGEVAHRYGSKGNVSVDPEVGLKLMEQVQDHLIAAIQNVHILITHQTRLLIAPHYLRSLNGFGQHALKTRPVFHPLLNLAGQTLIVGDQKPPATNRFESVPPGETRS
jgi:hypothetical protein